MAMLAVNSCTAVDQLLFNTWLIPAGDTSVKAASLKCLQGVVSRGSKEVGGRRCFSFHHCIHYKLFSSRCKCLRLLSERSTLHIT